MPLSGARDDAAADPDGADQREPTEPIGDSVSMASEAAATGKPVHVLNLDGGNAKFACFHEAMRAAGITRPFSGRIEGWSDPVPDDTTRTGPALQVLVLRRRKRA
jgi:mitochondrial fission protein ELM1